MSIKEQIATLPDNELHVIGRPTSPMFETTVSGEELKTLVRSHTQLLALTAFLDFAPMATSTQEQAKQVIELAKSL